MVWNVYVLREGEDTLRAGSFIQHRVRVQSDERVQASEIEIYQQDQVRI